MPEYLFSYGTLCDTQVQQRILGRTVPAAYDTLPNYDCLTFTPYPMAFPETGCDLPGLRLTIEKSDLNDLDFYEGDAYIRVQVRLASGLMAWVYEGSPVVMQRLLLVDF